MINVRERQRRTREQKLAFQNYLLGCVETGGYELAKEPATAKEKMNFVFETFRSEYGWSIKRYGEQKAFCEWLMGLPSSFNVEFRNHRIIELAKEFGFIPVDASEAQEERALTLWWASVYMAAQHVVNFQPVKEKKKVYPVRLVGEIRASFWESFPEFRSEYRPRKRQNDYKTDIRVSFVDYVDSLQKDGQISEDLAGRAIL